MAVLSRVQPKCCSFFSNWSSLLLLIILQVLQSRIHQSLHCIKKGHNSLCEGSAETAYHTLHSSMNVFLQTAHKQVHLYTTSQRTAITACMFSLAPIPETNRSHSEQKKKASYKDISDSILYLLLHLQYWLNLRTVHRKIKCHPNIIFNHSFVLYT